MVGEYNISGWPRVYGGGEGGEKDRLFMIIFVSVYYFIAVLRKLHVPTLQGVGFPKYIFGMLNNLILWICRTRPWF